MEGSTCSILGGWLMDYRIAELAKESVLELMCVIFSLFFVGVEEHCTLHQDVGVDKACQGDDSFREDSLQ